MRYLFFINAIIVAAFTYASAQVQEPSLEKGRIEDLSGVFKVYVGASNLSTSPPTTLTIIETVRKRLPQIIIVSLREEADVWLLFSEETGTETDSNPGPSLDARSSVKFVSVLRSHGKVIRLRGPNPARLVKKFSATGRSSDGNRFAKDFAEEFIKLYMKANPGKQSDVSPDNEQTTLPPSRLTGTTPSGASEPALVNIRNQEPEPPLERGGIEDLKGVTTVRVGAPDHYSSLFLAKIVDTVRKKIPGLVFVWGPDADIWLLFSVEGNVRDANVQGRIIRCLGPGRLRLVKQYSGKGTKGADGFAEEFVKSYQRANSGPQAGVAPIQETTSWPPRLKGEIGSVAVSGGVRSAVRNATNGAEVGDGDILRINTSLVTIHANVIGRDGKPAPDVRQDGFSVYEDDVKQDIAFFESVDRPFSVILLIDSSISVEGQLSEIVKAARVLVDHLRPDDQLVIITFDAMVKEVLKLTKIRELRGEWIKISPQGGTRIYDAVDFAASQYFPRLPGRKAVVLLTDGVDFGSFMATAEGSLHDAEEYDALFYTIQYKTAEAQPTRIEKTQQAYERATAYLQELAEKTGGRYQRAEDVGDLPLAFALVVKELSYQYSLGYYPKLLPLPGERRRIKVRVSRPDLVVHARDSYVFKSLEAKQAESK
jgi:Ca-activated chloride channel family protein